MQYVLLTGATGLVGRYLLRDLLSRTERVAVLVRPDKMRTGRDRVDALMGHWEQLAGRSLCRPVVLEGDLRQPGLGLSETDRRWLSDNCHSILHNAASMVFRKDNQGEPFRTNVEGMQNVLETCRQTGIRHFHHVSTCYLCGLRTGRILESEVDLGQELGNVYEESKLAAEKLVRQADFLDSLTIYRPASVVGDSQTGYCTSLHGFYHPLQLAYTVANYISPDYMNERFLAPLGLTGNERKNLVPVDWLSTAIVELFSNPRHHGETYQLASPAPVTVRLIQEIIQESIRKYSPKRAPSAISDSDLAGFESLFQEHMTIYESHWRDDPQFDISNTQRAIPDLPCPAMDYDRLMRVARFPVERKFTLPRFEPLTRTMDAQQQLKSSFPAPPNPPSSSAPPQAFGLQINGCGGGQWQLLVRDGRVVGVNAGLGADATTRYYLNIDTFASLVEGRSSIEQSIRSGRLLIEGVNGRHVDYVDILKQVLTTH